MSDVLKAMEDWHRRRHKARTDLLWLCNKVLGYPDASMRVHGPIIDALQKFPGANEFHKTEADFASAFQGKVLWEPKVLLPYLVPNEGSRGNRKLLILYPRGHMKSCISTIAHSIQWILNYPNVRILITTATEALGIDFVRQIKEQFLTNEKMRYLFPELCPRSIGDGKIMELGNQNGFMIPGRDTNNIKLGAGAGIKDLTVKMSTVGSAITGYHGDVFKPDDMVEKINASTDGGIDSVIYHFGTMEPLLEDYIGKDGEQGTKGWIDLTGTPWDYSDLYQTIRSSEENLPEERRTWDLVIRSAAPNWPNGPFLWPEKKGYSALKQIEDDPTQGPASLAAQYLMNPIVSGQGLIEDMKSILWVPRKEMNALLPRLTLYAALDLAGMDSESKGGDNDYTVLSVGGFNSDGRLYIPEIRYGRPTTDEVIEWIFDVFSRYPRLIKLKVEKEAHARVLLPFLKKEQVRRQKFVSIEAQPRSNQQSKKDKIKGLRPWFINGDIRFSEDLPCKTALETEIKGFPKFRHDDILDTLTDLMFEGKDVNSAVMGRDIEVPVGIPRRPPVDTESHPVPSISYDHLFGGDMLGGDTWNPFTGFRN
jgi:predicted phage terminase large subunit-like protein